MITRRTEINWGETIQGFASRVLGDASLWVDIAEINKLRHPYFTEPENASEFVAGYGDTILIPGGPGDVVSPGKVWSEDVFGRDVDLSNGNLSAVDGDLCLAVGRSNVKQALTNRILTDTSELIFHKEYGCDVRKLVGAKNSRVNNLLADMYVNLAIKQEARIQGVLSSSTIVDGDSIQIDFVAMTVTGHPVDIKADV